MERAKDASRPDRWERLERIALAVVLIAAVIWAVATGEIASITGV